MLFLFYQLSLVERLDMELCWAIRSVPVPKLSHKYVVASEQQTCYSCKETDNCTSIITIVDNNLKQHPYSLLHGNPTSTKGTIFA